MSKNCDRCGKEITLPFHYIPRNGKYYYCSDDCLLADYKGEPEVKRDHIMLRCPHCEQNYVAKIGNNPLVRDGLTITPVEKQPLESAVADDTFPPHAVSDAVSK